MPPLMRSALRTPLAALVLGGALASPVAAAEMEWSFETIGRGIKPALALDASDTPHVAFLTENMGGGVFYATNKSGAWTTSTVATGYFYGPVDIDVTADGVPYIAYHDHEDTRFRPELGGGVVAIGGGGWKLTHIKDRGHDQWDADIAVAADGTWHFAGIDPAQFGSRDGLEYATNAFGPVRVEQVGSGPIPYEFGVSIELRPGGGGVGITYFDADSADLRLAERTPGAGGKWTIATVESAGDVGRYSSLAYGADGTPHISYFARSGGGGTVRYATRDAGGNWQIEDIGTLDDVVAGMTGARKITSLALDSAGDPHVLFSDRDTVIYASRKNGAWSSATIFKTAGKLGQLVEFALDSQGRPHATFFEVTSTSGPLMGDIIYATAGKS